METTERGDKYYDNKYDGLSINNSNNNNDNLQNKLTKQIRIAQEQEFERYKNRLKKVKSGGVLLGASLNDLTPSPIINLINSENSMDESTKCYEKKKKSKKKKREAKSTLNSSTRKHKDKNVMPNGNEIYPMLNPWLNQSVYSFPMPYCDNYPIQTLPLQVMPMYNTTVAQFINLSNTTMFTSYNENNTPYIINPESGGVLHTPLDNSNYESNNTYKENEDRIVPLSKSRLVLIL